MPCATSFEMRRSHFSSGWQRFLPCMCYPPMCIQLMSNVPTKGHIPNLLPNVTILPLEQTFEDHLKEEDQLMPQLLEEMTGELKFH